MLTDATGISIALVASALAARPATPERTFGLQRAEVLAALANAGLLTVVAVWVLVSAVRRWDDPPEVATALMLTVAVVGALANVVGLLLLRSGARESVNVRGAYLEVLGDLLGSLAVVVAGVVIVVTGWHRADVVASVVIALMIPPRAWSLLREVVDVLLEATPRGVDVDAVRAQIRTVRGVVDVHDLHAWTITSGVPVLSAHVVVDEECIARGRSGEAGRPGGLPGRRLGRRALHLPAGARRPPPARGGPSLLRHGDIGPPGRCNVQRRHGLGRPGCRSP